MKISILQQDLYPALQAVSRSVGAKNLPVLANVLIQAEGKKVRLSATNLELGVIKEVEAEILEEGSLTVPARTFLEVIQSLSTEKLELEGVGEQLKITTVSSTKNFSGSLNGIAASEFPQIPLSSDQSVTIDAKLLHDSLPEITFAAAADEGRPVLTGILTEIKKDSLELVATDGFRLAHKTAKIETARPDGGGVNGLNFHSLIPRKTFEEVMRLIGEDTSNEEKIEISTSENQNQMIFKIGSTLVSSRLIEGQFPTWEKIVPTQFISKVIVDRSELIKAVKLAAVFAKSEANIVTIETTKDLPAGRQGKLTFTSAAKQLGEQKTELEAQIEGEPVIIAFNSKYLLDALNACPSDQVSIEFSGNLSPALIKPIGEKDLEYVVMPIRLS